MYDLLLINAHRQVEIEGGIICDWLGIYMLATYMEQNGYPARAFAGFAHEVEALLEKEIPRGVKVVGFSCDYENQAEVKQFCRLVRERWHLPVVVGGPQAIALGESFLTESGALAVVVGEGEIPLLALMQLLVDGSGCLENIPGLVFMRDGKEIRTKPAPPIANLDALPFIDPSLALGNRFRKSTVSIITARGCPFRCSFCYEGSNTRNVRWRSVDNVMRELRQTLDANPSVKFVLFTDDTFTLNAGRVADFTRQLCEYRKERDFGWFAEAHPQTILNHPEMLEAMVKAGLCSLQIGIESGDERVLKAYNKKTNPRMLKKAVSLCKAAGIPHLVGNIIVGGAFESRESLARSQDFGLELLELGAGMLELHAIHFWPLPNTAMTCRPQDFGLEILDPDSKTAVTDYPVVRCGNLGPEELSACRADMDACFKDKMRQIAAKMPPATVLQLLTIWFKYNLYTTYVDALIRTTRYRRFAALFAQGVICRARDINAQEIGEWHPQRQCQPLTREGRHFADDLEISPAEYQVLVASSGRMTVNEAAGYCGLSQEVFLKIAMQLEAKLALAFCRY